MMVREQYPRDLVVEAAQWRGRSCRASRRRAHGERRLGAIGLLLQKSYASLSRAVSTTTAERLSSAIGANVDLPQTWSRRSVGVESIAWRRIQPQAPRLRRR
jgi:hypothetical protein